MLQFTFLLKSEPNAVHDSTRLPEISILIVDDHPLFREGVAAFLNAQSGLRVVGAVGSEHEAEALAIDARPTVVLLDLRLGLSQGLDVLAKLKRLENPPRVLIVSSHDGDAMIRRALEAGADGYVTKNVPSAELVEAIRKLVNGERALCANIAMKVSEAVGKPELTDREIDIIELVGLGLSNKEVANKLGLSEKTVKNRLVGIFEKLEAADRTHAVVIAMERGFIGR